MELLYLVGVVLVVWLFARYIAKRDAKSRIPEPTDIPVTVSFRHDDDSIREPMTDEPAGDRDNWEGSFFDVQAPISGNARLRLDYIDGNGRKSERTVDVRQFGQYGADVMLIGHCHSRDATRTFLTSRIQRCVDEETGELVENVEAFLRAKYEASPEASLDRLFAEEFDVLRVLLYVGKADGQFRAAERAIVRETCVALAEDSRITDEMIDRMLREMELPTIHAFRLAVGRLARKGEASRGVVVAAAERMVATQKSVAPGEAEALEYLRNKLAPS